MSYGFYFPKKTTNSRSAPRSRREMIRHLRSQKASIARLSQPKQKSKNSQRTPNPGEARHRRKPHSAARSRSRPTAESIIDATTQEFSKFLTARHLERKKCLDTIGGLKHRPDSASVRRQGKNKKNMISKSKSFSPGISPSRKGSADAQL